MQSLTFIPQPDLTPLFTEAFAVRAQVLSLRKGAEFPGQNIVLDGEDEDEDGDDSSVLERKIRAASMSDAALKVCLKELKRFVLPHRCYSSHHPDSMWTRRTGLKVFLQ